MNLYMIRRSPDRYIADAYSYAVVAAESRKAARHTHPDKGVSWDSQSWIKGGRDYGFELWGHPLDLQIRLIGVAAKGMRAGAICTSFH